ncbi:MAG: hypothetical protein ACKN80_03405, partial [Actinomycetales bacterium]
MSLKIIDSTLLAKRVPIPKDFGVNPKLPILITSQVAELANWEPGRYLPATYGWQISPKNKEGLRTDSYKASLVNLESNLTSQYPNVAVNYPLNKLDDLIANQEHFSSLTTHALKILFIIFLFALILLLTSKFSLRKEILLIFLGLLLLIQQLWNFAILIQITTFLLLSIALIYLLNRALDSRLKKEDFQTLVLLRSSLRSITSISLLAIFFSATLFSSYQYLDRTQELRKQSLAAKVPFDFTLKIGPSLDKPLDLGSLSKLESLSSNTKAISAIRTTATLINESGDEKEINLLVAGEEKSWNEPRIDLPIGRKLTINTSGIAREIDLLIWLRTESGAHLSITATGTGIRTVELPASNLG